MTCPHQSQPKGKDTGRRLCALGRFNGRPWLGQCNECIKNKQNSISSLLDSGVKILTINDTKCFKLENITLNNENKKEEFQQECLRRNKSNEEGIICLSQEDFDYITKNFLTETKELPSVIQMAKNAANAAKQEVTARKAKLPPVSNEEQKRRMDICRTCEFFTPNILELPETKRKQERCVKCGCFMNFKTKLRSQHCPINKW